jgi:hypothetical protein
MRVFSQHESEDAIGLEIGPERLFKPFVMFVREHKTAIGNALNRSLVVALDVPDGDRFSEISERGDDGLCIDPTVMEMERSANAMIVQAEFGAPARQREDRTDGRDLSATSRRRRCCSR